LKSLDGLFDGVGEWDLVGVEFDRPDRNLVVQDLGEIEADASGPLRAVCGVVPRADDGCVGRKVALTPVHDVQRVPLGDAELLGDGVNGVANNVVDLVRDGITNVVSDAADGIAKIAKEAAATRLRRLRRTGLCRAGDELLAKVGHVDREHVVLFKSLLLWPRARKQGNHGQHKGHDGQQQWDEEWPCLDPPGAKDTHCDEGAAVADFACLCRVYGLL